MGPVSKLLLSFVALFTTFLVLDLSQGQARGPAVEAMAAIAIDQNKPADPKKIQGFDFNQPAAAAVVAAPKQTIMNIPVAAKTPKQTLLFIGIVMVLLPLTIWVGIMKNLKGDDTELLRKVEKLPHKNKFSKKEKDQDSYPKAS
jgi:hypothetical protein